MKALAQIIDRINEYVGRTAIWLTLGLVVVQFALVVLRYVFGFGSVWLQELVIYMHGLLFLLAAGYTLLHDAHVRVDIFYREASPRYQALVNLVGSVFLLIPVCILIGIESWPFVKLSWMVHEGSRETSGIPAVYLFKTAIPVFAVLLGLQGLSLAIHSARTLLGREVPTHEAAPKL